MLKKWQTLSTKKLADYFVVSVFAKERRSPITSETHTFYTFEAPNWANIVAITPGGKAIMVHQYRHGIDDFTLEFPAGIAEDGETSLDTIRRELLEETGYTAEDIELIGSVDTNPAFLNNKCYSYSARNVRKVGIQKLDETESVEVIEVPLNDIPEMIAEGKVTHSLSIAAYYFYIAKGKDAKENTISRR